MASASRPISDSSGVDEEQLRAAVQFIREQAEDEMTTEAVFEVLRGDTAFKQVTMAGVRRAESTLTNLHNAASGDSLQQQQQLDAMEESDEEEYELDADAALCRVSGDGLRSATVRRPAFFWIEAYDYRGTRRESGGDKFLVSIRGMSQTRARITDNNDGTYLVAWKPHVSGYYSISISHAGKALPDTPFTCNVQPTMPSPTNCILRGEHLKTAVSRTTHYFEVLFKDKLNQVREHAVHSSWTQCMLTESQNELISPHTAPTPQS